MNSKAIAQLLPEVYQRAITPASPLEAILQVMADQHEPITQALEIQHEALCAYRSSNSFLFLLAHFVDVNRFLPKSGVPGTTQEFNVPPSTGIGRLRELVQAAPTLSKLRGTRSGLQLFLETATGLKGFQLIDASSSGDNSTVQASFHLDVHAPEAAKPHQAFIEQIIEQEKPAFITYKLFFKDTK